MGGYFDQRTQTRKKSGDQGFMVKQGHYALSRLFKTRTAGLLRQAKHTEFLCVLCASVVNPTGILSSKDTQK